MFKKFIICIAILGLMVSSVPTAQATYLDETKHIVKFGGNIWYVNKGTGSDANTGTEPVQAFETIGAGIAAMSDGDAINVKAGTYTEAGIDLDHDAGELWLEIGVLIDPAASTGLVVSGNSCRVTGYGKITPAALATGLSVTGNECELSGIRVFDGAVGVVVTGTGVTLNNFVVGTQTTTSYDIQGARTRLYRCKTMGAGATTGYKINASADNGVLEQCTSSGHTTAGYYIDTGSSGWTVYSCSSGAGDGRYRDIDEVNFWSGFTYANFIEKGLNIAQAGAGTHEYNLFKITGVVKIISIMGVVETTLTGTNTACYLDVYSANGTSVITKATGVAIGAALKGSVVGRLEAKGVALYFANAAAPFVIDATTTPLESFRVGEDRTAGAHVATYIRFIHTTAGASTGEIDWYIKYEPVSDDGFVSPA